MQGFGLDRSRVYVKQAGALWKTSWTYFVVQFLRLYWDPRVLHNCIDVHFVRDPGYQVLNMIGHRLTSQTERKSTLSASLQLFGSSGAGIRSSSGLLPSSVLFHLTLYVLTLGDGDATQATSADSSSTRKVVGASGRVVNVPVRGAEHVSTSLPKGTARCSTCFFWWKLFIFHVLFYPPAPHIFLLCRQCQATWRSWRWSYPRPRSTPLCMKALALLLRVDTWNSSCKASKLFLDIDQGQGVTKVRLSTGIHMIPPLHYGWVWLCPEAQIIQKRSFF